MGVRPEAVPDPAGLEGLISGGGASMSPVGRDPVVEPCSSHNEYYVICWSRSWVTDGCLTNARCPTPRSTVRCSNSRLNEPAP